MSIPLYRAVFVSDVHLGFHLSREEEFCSWLESLQCEQLYLNGDVFDGWRLRRKFRWNEFRTRIIDRLHTMHQGGIQVFVVPGNHDEFLRKPLPEVLPVPVSDEFVHECLSGRKLLVTHGDLLDPVEKNGRAISKMGSILFDAVSSVVPVGVSHWIKRSSKSIFGRPGSLGTRIQELARRQGLGGAIFGHIHRPSLEQFPDGFVLANCGDWVEHTSFVAELMNGELVLVNQGVIRTRIGLGAGLSQSGET